MSNYVKRIRIPGTIDGSKIDFAVPVEGSTQRVINVLCGQNGTGKSYVLAGIRDCLQLRWVHLVESPPHTKRKLIEMGHDNDLQMIGIYVEMTNRQPQPRVLALTRLKDQDIKNAGIVGLGRNPKQVPSDRAPLSTLISEFAYRQVSAIVDSAKSVRLEDWQKDVSKRRELVGAMPPDDLHKCVADEPFLKILEDLLDARLYIRHARPGNLNTLGQLEFALLQGDGTQMVFDVWSDGQKAIFYFLTMIHMTAPDILLIDELENHLHPAYMSEILEFVKKHVSQTIITTHHPHVIFSGLVDKVVYLETSRPAAHPDPPPKLSHTNTQHQSAPSRKVFTLDSSFDKLTKVYELFSHQDRQLLWQAQLLTDNTEMLFFESLAKALTADVISSSERPMPDTQSGQLVQALRSRGIVSRSIQKGTVILDWGAGVGRTQVEIAKLTNWQIGDRLSWICLESDDNDRAKLRQSLDSYGIDAKVVKNVSEVEDGSIDVCVFANVLHHLTPVELAETMQASAKKLHPKGQYVILEIYPPKRAEKFAVPYSSDRLCLILRKAGLIVSSDVVSVQSATAYVVVATKSPGSIHLNIKADVVLKATESQWDEILEDAIESYMQIHTVEDAAGYRRMASALTTIASITSWKLGLLRHTPVD